MSIGSCQAPITIARPLSSFRLDNPDRPDSSSAGAFFCRRTGVWKVRMEVPCSKCAACLAGKASQWAVRGYCESLSHEFSSFLTLTYDDDHLPSDGRLVKDHLVRFCRRAQLVYPRSSFFSCGEYGDNFGRPHYHAVFFGADFGIHKSSRHGDMWVSPILSEMWRFGHASLAPASMATICYTVGYVAKKIGNPDVFQYMPRFRGGLGKAFVDQYEDELRRTGRITIEGRHYPLPKYFFTRQDFSDLKRARSAAAEPIRATARNNRAINALHKSKRSRGSL